MIYGFFSLTVTFAGWSSLRDGSYDLTTLTSGPLSCLPPSRFPTTPVCFLFSNTTVKPLQESRVCLSTVSPVSGMALPSCNLMFIFQKYLRINLLPSSCFQKSFTANTGQLFSSIKLGKLFEDLAPSKIGVWSFSPQV